MFKGLIATPSLDDQFKDMEDTRNTLAARFIDRQQLRVQHGIDGRYYQDLAYAIGCEPTPWRVLTERPTAFWHAFFTNTGQIRNRLVGPGRLENAEMWAEERYTSRHYGEYMDAGGEYDNNPLAGELRNGDGNGPINRRSWMWGAGVVRGWYAMGRQLMAVRSLASPPQLDFHAFSDRLLVVQIGKEGNVVGPIPFLQRPQQIKDHLEQNWAYAKEDEEKRGIAHSMSLNAEVKDGYLDQGGEKSFAFGDRASADGGGLVSKQEEVVEEAAAAPGEK